MPNQQCVFIVDDAPVNLKLFRILLEAQGYRVETAGDAEEALVLLDTLRPDLILMDIQLPRMDGLELTRRLKASEGFRDVPVVALTAYATQGDSERALAAGCAAYLFKPIDTRNFGKTVAELIAKHGSAEGTGKQMLAAEQAE